MEQRQKYPSPHLGSDYRTAENYAVSPIDQTFLHLHYGSLEQAVNCCPVPIYQTIKQLQRALIKSPD